MNDVSRITVTPDYFFLDTGSPHYVKVVADAFQTDVVTAGRMIRYAPSFQPGGTNVNFITPTPACIRIATYEWGVEDETLACGTGCVAAALSAALLNHDHSGTYTLQTKGGILKVSFKQLADNHFTDIWLEGPAEFVFAGEIETPQNRDKKAM